MSLDKLPINAFDLVLVLVILGGIARGRKVGMSGELISLLTWLGILFGCALAYEPAGQIFSQSTGTMGLGLLSSYILAYLVAAAVIYGLFMLLKRSWGGKLTGSDTFGNAEYYLGIVSAVARCLCMLLVSLALLNARHYTQAEINAELKFQNDVYGSNFFPTLHSLQATVFEKSLTGPIIHDYLGFLLIKPTDPDNRTIQRPEAVKL